MTVKVKSIGYIELICKKQRGGARALWHAGHPMYPSIIGAGSTADLAIRDWQAQYRRKVRRG